MKGIHLIVGTGSIAGAHAATLQRLGEKIAFAGRSHESAQGFAQGYPGSRAYPSFQEGIADPEVRSVVLCLPHDLHEEFSVASLDGGKHLLLEKPLAHTLVGADTILAASARNPQAVVMVAEQLEHLPALQPIRSLLSCCGEELRYRFTDLSPHIPTGWRNDLSRSGGGVMLDLGHHYLALALALFGPVESAKLRILRKNALGVPVSEEMELIHVSGKQGSIAVAWEEENALSESGIEIRLKPARLRYRIGSRLLWIGGIPYPISLRDTSGRRAMMEEYLHRVTQAEGGEMLQNPISSPKNHREILRLLLES